MNSKEQVFAISPGWAILTVVVVFVLSIFLGAFFFRFFGVGLALVFGEMLIALIPFGYMLYKRIDIKRYIGFEVKLKYILLGKALALFYCCSTWSSMEYWFQSLEQVRQFKNPML